MSGGRSIKSTIIGPSILDLLFSIEFLLWEPLKIMAVTCYYPNISITRVIMKDTPPHLKRQTVGGVKYLWPNKFNLDSIIFYLSILFRHGFLFMVKEDEAWNIIIISIVMTIVLLPRNLFVKQLLCCCHVCKAISSVLSPLETVISHYVSICEIFFCKNGLIWKFLFLFDTNVMGIAWNLAINGPWIWSA